MKVLGIIVLIAILLFFVGMIVGMVMIGKWSEEGMDRIMEMEEEKRKNQKTKIK